MTQGKAVAPGQTHRKAEPSYLEEDSSFKKRTKPSILSRLLSGYIDS